ncbi:hypothetical protein [Flavobacterium sp.]|uniref:WD40 repeat domain-containing protein n=1 Tax=Flavobacterium sp. TaxID=239 RepID=UPI002636DF4E|nr:hypothetical protein [Flavobacterium sp.]
MKYYLLIALFFSLTIHSQSTHKCERIYSMADSLCKKGDYALAIKKISAYKICAQTFENKKADDLLLKIYETVNKQKEDAIQAKQEALKQKALANSAKNEAIKEKENVKKTFSNADFAQYNANIKSGNDQSGTLNLIRSLKTMPSNVGALSALYAKLTLSSFPIEISKAIKTGNNNVKGVSHSNDGKYIVVFSHEVLSIVNLSSNTVKNIPNPFSCYLTAAVISPTNGQILIAGGFDGNMRQQGYGEFSEFDIETGKQLYDIKKVEGMLWNAHYSPEGSKYFVATAFDTQLFESQTGTPKTTIDYCKDKTETPDNSYANAAVSDNAEKIITLSGLIGNGCGQIYHCDKLDKTGDPINNEYGFYQAKFSPDNKSVTITSPSPMSEFLTLSKAKFGFAQIYNAETGAMISNPLDHHDLINTIDYSPDGTLIVTASSDNTAKVWYADTGELKNEMSHQGPINSARFSPDGLLIVTASSDRTIKIWDRSGNPYSESGVHNAEVIDAYFNAIGNVVISICANGEIHQWDPSLRRMMPTVLSVKSSFAEYATENIILKQDSIVDSAIKLELKIVLLNQNQELAETSHNKKYNAIITANGLQIMDSKTGDMQSIQRTHNGHIYQATFNSNDEYIATASEDSTAVIWNINKAKSIKLSHPSAVYSCTFSNDNNFVMTSCGHSMYLWDIRGRLLKGPIDTNFTAAPTINENGEKEYYPDDIVDLKFTADDNNILVTYGYMGSSVMTSRIRDFTVDGYQLWDVKAAKLDYTLLHNKDITSCTLSKNKKFIVTTSWDKTAKIWSAKPGYPTVELLNDDVVNNSVQSPDGNFLLTYGESNKCFLYNTKDFTQRGQPLVHNESVKHAIFSPNSKVAIVSSGNVISLWDVNTSQLITNQIVTQSNVKCMSIDPSGYRLLTLGENGEVMMWDIVTGENDNLAETCIEIAEKSVSKSLNDYNVEQALDPSQYPQKMSSLTDGISNQIRTWFNAVGEQRKISPNATITTKEVVDEMIKENSLQELYIARLLMPSNTKILSDMSDLASFGNSIIFSKIWKSIYINSR